MPNLLHRFIAIGDTHYGANSQSSEHYIGTDLRQGPSISPGSSNDRMDLLNDKIEKEKAGDGLDFIIFIGDMVHGNTGLQSNVDFRNNFITPLDLPYYVAYGNHDYLNDAEWETAYGHKRDHAIEFGDYAMIIINTSDTSGGRSVCRSQEWLKSKLSEFKDKKGVFFVAHIPRKSGGFRGDPITSPANWGADAPDCPGIMKALVEQDNLICQISGHFHEYNNIITQDSIPVIFTNHWGQYGVDQYGVRIFEVYDDGSIYAKLDGFTATYNQSQDEWDYEKKTSSYLQIPTKYTRRDRVAIEGKRVFIPINL